VILVSACASGQEGPDAHFGGYAPLFGAWGGLGTLSGYPDGPPLELRHAMDHGVGLTAAAAALAALHRRRMTGVGSHVDLSAREVAASMIGEALLQAAHGDPVVRLGNAHPAMAPHGVYPALGEDRWLTIAVGSDAQWQAVVTLAASDGLSLDESGWRDTSGRLAGRAELDERLAMWTRKHDAEDLAERLQAQGIAAHASLTPEMLVADVHMRARGAVRDVQVGGQTRPAVRVPVGFSKTPVPGIVEATPPLLGGAEDEVFGGWLGLSGAERQALEKAGVIA